MRSTLVGLLGPAAICAAALAHPTPYFRCSMAGTANGWCEGCRAGYLATVEIRSKTLFDGIDPHGHDLDLDGLLCAGCREAWATDGYCYDCRIGFVDGHGYHTMLTYRLARGEIRDPATITCPVCAEAARDTTLPLDDAVWCEACGRGMLGNVEYTSRKEYSAARKQFELLLRAVKESERCEMCALLMFYGGICRTCNITYKNGKVVPAEKPATRPAEPAGKRDD